MNESWVDNDSRELIYVTWVYETFQDGVISPGITRSSLQQWWMDAFKCNSFLLRICNSNVTKSLFLASKNDLKTQHLVLLSGFLGTLFSCGWGSIIHYSCELHEVIPLKRFISNMWHTWHNSSLWWDIQEEFTVFQDLKKSINASIWHYF